MNDWRVMAGPKPTPEPCRVCGEDKPREVAANLAMHSRAAVCSQCLSIIGGIYNYRQRVSASSEMH